ncbi:MAG: hypothetical protein R8G60_08580 [Roseovarius pacificus]|nr:hypothetical protein [Roseovarius pacificus]
MSLEIEVTVAAVSEHVSNVKMPNLEPRVSQEATALIAPATNSRFPLFMAWARISQMDLLTPLPELEANTSGSPVPNSEASLDPKTPKSLTNVGAWHFGANTGGTSFPFVSGGASVAF